MKKLIRCVAASLCVLAPLKALAEATNLYINIKPKAGILVKSNGGEPIAMTFSGDLNGAGYSAECRIRKTGPNSIEYVPGGESIKIEGPVIYGGSAIPFNSDYQNFSTVYTLTITSGVKHSAMYLINKKSGAYQAFDTRDGNASWRPRESKVFTSEAIMGTGKALATDLCGALVQYYPAIVDQSSKYLLPDQLCPNQPKGATREQTIQFCEEQTLGQYRTIGLTAPAQ